MWCDFGLARTIDDIPSGLTTSRNATGTIRYLSPELLEEESPYKTLRSDVWAWGCVFVEVRYIVLRRGRCPDSDTTADYRWSCPVLCGAHRFSRNQSNYPGQNAGTHRRPFHPGLREGNVGKVLVS